jgi:hypothetical protein
MFVQLPNLLLALLLLTGQALLALHQLDFDQHPEGGEECAMCLAAQSATHAGASGTGGLSEPAVDEPPIAPLDSAPLPAAPPFHLARAPPLASAAN